MAPSALAGFKSASRRSNESFRNARFAKKFLGYMRAKACEIRVVLKI
jgi:hypothetical protein